MVSATFVSMHDNGILNSCQLCFTIFNNVLKRAVRTQILAFPMQYRRIYHQKKTRPRTCIACNQVSWLAADVFTACLGWLHNKVWLLMHQKSEKRDRLPTRYKWWTALPVVWEWRRSWYYLKVFVLRFFIHNTFLSLARVHRAKGVKGETKTRKKVEAQIFVKIGLLRMIICQHEWE